MIPVLTIQIDTDLALRKIMPMDAEEIFATIDREREFLGQWLPFVAETTKLSYTIDFLNTILEAEDEKDVCVFTIRYQEQFVGVIGFKASDIANKKTEIGYWLSEKHQHKGIMTRCVKTLCDRAFKKFGMNRIQIKCAVGNTPSKAIPKRLGFHLEGVERDGEQMSNGEYVDLEIYSLLKRESL